MNIVANNIATKLFVAFVAAAMVFTLAAKPAKAQTAEELQQMINQLLAQVAALQGQIGQGGSVAAGVCPYTWTRTLTTGATGADVMKLQQFLNADADTRVSASGVGSAGMETEYFGPATAAAVSKLQVKYRSDILSPAGLVNPTGTFGPATMAKANALCVGGSTSGGDDTSSDDSSDDSSNDDNGSVSLSGEANLKSFDIEDGDDADLEEGQTEESVQEFVVEFEDGDAKITRLDVEFDTDATDDLWDVLGDVTLYVDGDEVKSIDGSDEDNYQSDDMTLRFSGLDIVAMEDEETTITLGVEVQDNLDTADQTVGVDVTGMRFVDADDVTSTLDESEVDADAGSFDISAAGSEDELIVKSSTEDPEATTLIVDDQTSKSDWYTVFAFDLDTDDSVNDIDLNTIAFELTAGTADVNDVVQDAELVIDGVTYDDWDWSGADDPTMVMSFDIDGDHTIDAGDRVTAELKLRFFGNDGESKYGEGETIQATASTTLFDAEGVEDVDATGAASSEEHTLRSSGLVADASSVETDESTSGQNDDVGTFEISFDVTALEGDFYVATTTDGATPSIAYTVEGPGTITDSFVLSSTGEEDTTDVFTVSEGETETFTLTVTVSSDAAGSFRVTADSITFSEDPDGVTGAETQDLLPASSYRTAFKQVNT